VAAKRLELERRARRLIEKHERVWIAPFQHLVTKWRWRRGFVDAVVVLGERAGAALPEILRYTPLAHATIPKLDRDSWARLSASPALGRLTSFDLSNARIGVEQVLELCTTPAGPRLEALTLADIPIGRPDALSALARLPRLRRLGLDGTGTDDD